MCQQVKAEHHKPTWLLQPLEVAEWKWEHVTMDFMTHFPRTPQGHDAIWVIVDRLTKLAHFLAMRMTFTLERFCRLYIREVVRLHGVPVSIVSDKDPSRVGSGLGENGYSSKPAPFGPGMDYTYWTVDVYGDTRINLRGDGGGDGLTLTPAPYPPHPHYPLNK